MARGFAPLHVEKPENKLPVQLMAAAASRSKTLQTVKVKTVPNAQLTVAVVDEGILQLKDFKTPQPYDYFYQKRALEVKSYDLYPLLFPELSYRSSSTGGDGYDLSKRINPLTSKRVRLVALWSGHLQTNAAGEAAFTFDVPQFSGALRVMAVAYKGAAFGSADHLMKISDPVVISTALPRFLSPRDTVLVPVTLSNTTEKAGTATAKIKTTGAVSVVGASSQKVNLQPNTEQQVQFKVLAQPKIGLGEVVVSVDALNETFSEKTELSVRPAASLQKVTDNGVISGGGSISINTNNDFLPASVSSELLLSKSPVVQFSEDIRYLIQYPYGCLEQTISAVFPQLYFMDLAKAVGQEKKPMRYNPNYLVQEAIRKVEAMQLYNGAIAYWPGGDSENWWSSAYAAHFLTEAKKAGFAVNDKILDKLLQYLRFKVRQKEKEEYNFINEQGQQRHKTIAKKEIFYSLYVLAMHCIYEQSTMNYYKSNPDLMAIDSKYLLAGTYYLAGNATAYRSLLPINFKCENSVRELEGSFYSAIRDEAVALNTLLEVEPNHPDVGVMAKHLSAELKKARWLNTQERAFSLVALGKLSRKAAAATVTADVLVDGKKVAEFTGKDLRLPQGLANKQIQIKTSGSGNLYYFVETEGISASGTVKEEDQYLKVRRTYYDRQGREIRSNTFQQNDLVVVKLSIQSTDYNRSVPNVAITDLLPAGFEIENPRIGAVRELSWIKDMANPDYFDIRDDRISYFTTATGKPKHFYY
ncbi:MAG: alpha-2-macroglobulin family protein, partial [Hymenobacteraceae bacterium]|nr:alpha-2-macroglobulin family protein [Hymenobacteraceae bacterium]MDX5511385.1 alpha-2-macroglobulin family protein [Hymenobacteraceae bacterium]